MPDDEIDYVCGGIPDFCHFKWIENHENHRGRRKLMWVGDSSHIEVILKLLGRFEPDDNFLVYKVTTDLVSIIDDAAKGGNDE